MYLCKHPCISNHNLLITSIKKRIQGTLHVQNKLSQVESQLFLLSSFFFNATCLEGQIKSTGVRRQHSTHGISNITNNKSMLP